MCPFSLHRKTRTSLPLGIVDPLIGEFVIDESFTWNCWSLFTQTKSEADCQTAAGGKCRSGLIALLRDGVVRVVGECEADMHM